MRNARWWAASMVLVGLLATGAACSGDDDDSASSRDAAVSAAEGGGDGGDVGSEASGEEGLGLPAGDPIQAGRSIIANAEVSIEVEDTAAAAAAAVDLAGDAGGFLAQQELEPEEGVASLTLRIPTARFQDALGDLEALGEVLSQRIDTDDVTEQVVDLESRIASARASVDRVRDLLAGSGDVVQLAAVERELAQREATLESLLGSQRVLDDQVALATVRVELREAAAADDDDDLPGFMGGLEGGWDGFLTAASVIVTGLGYALPFLVVASVGGGLWLWVRRSRSSAPAA